MYQAGSCGYKCLCNKNIYILCKPTSNYVSFLSPITMHNMRSVEFCCNFKDDFWGFQKLCSISKLQHAGNVLTGAIVNGYNSKKVSNN